MGESCGIPLNVTIEVPKRPYSTGEKILLFVVRMLTATIFCALLLTAIVLSYDHAVTGRDGYAFSDGMFLLAVSIPFIFGGLVVLGLPAIYALARWKAESARNYALVGAATGVIWGAIIAPKVIAFFVISALCGCSCALFWWWLRPRN